MGIVFWTNASQKDARKVILSALSRLKHQPAYRIAPVETDPPVVQPGEHVLAMGKEAYQLMAAHGFARKGRAISSLRGTLFTNPFPFMFTDSPAMVSYDPAVEQGILWDVQLIARWLRTGSGEAELGDYKWVLNFDDVIADVEAKYAKTGTPVAVACDIETSRLSPFYADGRILGIGFTATEGKADLLYLPDLQGKPDQARYVLGQVHWLLNTPKVKLRGANFKFDLNWILKKWGIPCSNFSMDTLLVGSSLDENRTNSLKDHVKYYCPELGGYDDAMTQAEKENMASVSKEKMLPYFGGDVDGTLRVSNIMLTELAKQPSLLPFYFNILHPAGKVFQRVEREGLPVNKEKYAALRGDLVTEIAEVDKLALAMLPARIKARYADNLSLTRPVIMRDFFFSPLGLNLTPRMLTAKDHTPSTAKAHFEMFGDVAEAKEMCELLDRRAQATKAMGTYVDGFLTHLQPDGRFRPTYFLHNGDNEWGDHEGGTNTGRLSAIAPAIQTVPKRTLWGKRIRECIEAEPDHELLECDYAQGELKLAACVAEEENMLQVYHNGLDLHTKTGAAAAQMSYEDLIALEDSDPKMHELYRYRAKAQNFGLLYGMGDEGFMIYAWKGYRLRFSLAEASAAVEVFHNTYPGLRPWHQRKKAQAREYRQIVTPLGRVRHLPHIFSSDKATAAKAGRQAANSEIQSMLSDMMCWAMDRVEQQFPMYAPVATIHDAGYWMIPKKYRDRAPSDVTSVMASLPFEKTFGWKPQLTFNADAKLGDNMANFKKVKL